MLYVSTEFFFVYAILSRSSCYADRDTHCMPTVIPIVCRPSYALYVGRHTRCAAAVVQPPLWCNEERFKTYSANHICATVLVACRRGKKRSEEPEIRILLWRYTTARDVGFYFFVCSRSNAIMLKTALNILI